MLPKIDAISSLLPEIEAPNLLSSIGTNKQSVIEKIIQFSKGQNFQAEVIAKLSNGQFQIKIAETKLTLNLPNSPQVGDKLNFTISALTPRIVLMLEGFGSVIIDDPVSSQQILNQFEDLVKKADGKSVKLSTNNQIELSDHQTQQSLLKNTTQSSSIDLSDTAKIINQLLKEAALLPSISKANISNNTPLLLAPSMSEQAKSTTAILNSIANMSNALNLQLKNQITSSGLFYESHVAAWLIGKFQQEKLRQEPQANIPLELKDQILNKTDNIHHEKAVQLIHQQLDVGENNRINWHGMLFPDAPMEWSVSEDQTSSTESKFKEESQNSWNSTIRLSLPALGDIEIRLQLQSQHLSLNIKAKQTHCVDILKESQNILNQSLQNTGIILQALSISQHDEAKNER